MNRLVYTAFVAFWSVVITLLAVHALAPSAIAGHDSADAVFTLEDVAAHDSEDDCWMVVEDKVYDFTAYIPKHPAPPFVMTQWCGKDATEGMRTKGYGREHSPAAWAMMEEYLVGKLKDD